MGKVLVTDTYLTNIGNAIRGKNGSTIKYKPSEMAKAIDDIVVSNTSANVDGGSSNIPTGNFAPEFVRFGESKGYQGSKLTLTGLDTSNITDMTYMFFSCYHLVQIVGMNFNTSKVTNMTYMFSNCSSLIDLSQTNISQWDVSNVTSMDYMFNNCISLTDLNVDNWDLSSLATGEVNQDIPNGPAVNSMFYACNNLSDDSLNSIMKMLATAPGYSSLSVVGFDETQRKKMQTLSNWQTLADKGWTI